MGDTGAGKPWSADEAGAIGEVTPASVRKLVTCRRCGAVAPAGGRFCAGCGAAYGSTAGAPTAGKKPWWHRALGSKHAPWVGIAGALTLAVIIGVAATRDGEEPASTSPPAASQDLPADDPVTSNTYYQELEVGWPRFPYNQQMLWCGMYSQGPAAFEAWLEGYGSGTQVDSADVAAMGAFLDDNCPP